MRFSRTVWARIWHDLETSDHRLGRSHGSRRSGRPGQTASRWAPKSRCQPQHSEPSAHRRAQPRSLRRPEARCAASRCRWSDGLVQLSTGMSPPLWVSPSRGAIRSRSTQSGRRSTLGPAGDAGQVRALLARSRWGDGPGSDCDWSTASALLGSRPGRSPQSRCCGGTGWSSQPPSPA